MRRTLVAAAATLALTAGACASDGTVADGLDDGTSGDATTTSTVDDDGAADRADTEDTETDPSGDDVAGTGEPDPAVTGGGSDPDATTAPQPSSTEAPSGQEDTGEQGGSVDPIPAGTYTYDTSGTRQLGDNPEQQLPETTTLEAGPANSDDEQVRVRDLRDEDGYGGRNSTTLRYGVEGAVLLASTIESTVEIFGSPFTSTNELEADPPVLIGPLDAEVGFRATLHLVSDDVTVDGTLEIIRRETVTIGGTAVDTFVVDVHYDLSGEVEGTSDATWWVRPSDLLNVREEVATDVESRGLRYTEQYEAVLTSLEAA